jgi:hypothetical protein
METPAVSYDLPGVPTDAILLVTTQADWWRSRDGLVRVVEMEPSHRRKVLALLRGHAETWQIEHAMHPATPVGSVDTAPGEWIEAQPLVQRLAALVAADTVPAS